MAMATSKTQCYICNKVKIGYKCEGCSKMFCFDHLTEHRQTLGQQLDEIENDRNLFQQTIVQQKQNTQNHSIFHQINQWEQESIIKIKQTAEQCKQIFTEHINKYIYEIENKFMKLTKQLIQIREENEFNEIDLDHFKKKLEQLSQNLIKTSNISIQQDSSSSFINKISVISSEEYDCLFGTSETEPSIPQLKENLSPHADSQLVKLFKSVNDQGTTVTDQEILTYIREHMDSNEKFYIQNIVLSHLEACVIDRGTQKKIQEDIAKKRMTILNAIIEHKLEAEIQALYAIQKFVHKLGHPPKMARLLFDIFYDEECVSDDAFFEWLKHPDQSETEGHAVVEMSTKDFFAWVQQAETEDEEDEEEGS